MQLRKDLFVFLHKPAAVLFCVISEYISGSIPSSLSSFSAAHFERKSPAQVNEKRAFVFLNGRISELWSWGSPTDFAHTDRQRERERDLVDSAETLNSIWVIQLISASVCCADQSIEWWAHLHTHICTHALVYSNCARIALQMCVHVCVGSHILQIA